MTMYVQEQNEKRSGGLESLPVLFPVPERASGTENHIYLCIRGMESKSLPYSELIS